MSACVYAQGSIHASLTSSSKMAAISSAMLAAAASEEEESAESILERHMSQCSVFSDPDSHNPIVACHSASGSCITQHRGAQVASGGRHPDNYTARHGYSSSLTHSRSAVEGSWSVSDHHPPTFRMSASFGDDDLPQPVCRPYISEMTGPDHQRTAAPSTNLVASRHHQQRPSFSCPHAEADRK